MDTTEVQRIIWEYYERIYTTKFDNLEVMDKFSGIHNLPRLNYEELENQCKMAGSVDGHWACPLLRTHWMYTYSESYSAERQLWANWITYAQQAGEREKVSERAREEARENIEKVGELQELSESWGNNLGLVKPLFTFTLHVYSGQKLHLGSLTNLQGTVVHPQTLFPYVYPAETGGPYSIYARSCYTKGLIQKV